ncbi:MAG: hypothetical protein QN141_13350, partial [Armatimonadota bacterium]|nr:hypothetical protein [Armatimonadota bacterium]
GIGPGNARAYGAGVNDATLTLSDSQDPAWTGYTPVGWRLADSSFTGEWFNGRMACVKAWTAALTVAELEAERWYAMPVRRADLWYCNPMEGPASAFTQDYSGNGNTLTASGTLTLEDGPPVAWAPRKLWRGWSRPAGAPPPPPPTGLRRLLVGVGR